MASPSQPQPQPQPQQQQQPPFHDFQEPPLAIPLLLPAPPLQSQQPPPSTRRLPPPCWTPDETSALIDAYRNKWYSLRRGNLRAAHWQDVADDVHRACPNVSPPKTAVQCRHKMEKLRKRYRAELQRAKSIPHHRFSSSWVYFSKMQSMEKGADSEASPGGGKINPSFLSPPVVVNDGYDDVDVDDDGDDNDDDEEYRSGSFKKEMKDFQRNGLRIRIAGKNNYGGFDQIPNPNPNLSSKFGYKSSPLSRFNEFKTPPLSEDRMRYGMRGLKNGSNGGGIGSSSGMGMGMNVVMKKKRSALGKRERERGRKRGGDEVALAMVEAIRVMGEGFLRMEESKMEMMRVFERQRMENELKHTQMILQYQQSIVQNLLKESSDPVLNKGDDGNNDSKDVC